MCRRKLCDMGHRLAYGPPLLLFPHRIDRGCAESQCPILSAPLNGWILGPCSSTIGSTCYFNCRDSHRLVGTSVLTCQAGGVWSATPPYCGSITGTCSPGVPGQVCFFSCVAGYQLVGRLSLTCTVRGTWDGTVPVCVPSSGGGQCPSLPRPLNGVAQGSCAPGVTGQVCQFTCLPGFQLVGPTILRCTSSGVWDGQPPSCNRQTMACRDLVAPPGGVLEGTCAPGLPGQRCSLACREGYELSGGSSPVVCQPSGQWSGTLPVCIGESPLSDTGRIKRDVTIAVLENECPSLLAPQNGELLGQCDPGFPGESCWVNCRSGFRPLSGQSRVVCLESGSWSGQLAACLRSTLLRKLPRTLSSFRILVWDPGSVSTEMTCPGQTSGCPNLPQPAVGAALRDLPAWSTGSTLHPQLSGRVHALWKLPRTLSSFRILVWDPGSVPTEPPRVLAVRLSVIPAWCSSVALSVPVYRQRSGAARRLYAGGSITGTCSPGVPGQVCFFSCVAGYQLVGRLSLTCTVRGTGDGTVPVCVPSSGGGQCPSLPRPLNGVAQGSCAPGVTGQVCQFTCLPGFQLVGPTILRCTSSGVWDGQPPSCNRQTMACRDLVAPPGGVLEGTCAPGLPGQRCSLACREGYELSGGSSQGGVSTIGAVVRYPPRVYRRVLLGELPLGVPSVERAVAGGVSGIGVVVGTTGSLPTISVVMYVVVSEVTCPGQTSGCPNLPQPAVGQLSGTCQPGVEGLPCTLNCPAGSTLSGNSLVLCLASGSWSGTLGVCQREYIPW
ncbi:SELP [Cordylochernes scorpioides]|uniref:SELP n=1 Tax=Cordylochernes scorpioides TaxID=51811 RepID=A0ABY6KV96_9ARAC|nr:SELP [Cordylochernes scorpioides]